MADLYGQMSSRVFLTDFQHPITANANSIADFGTAIFTAASGDAAGPCSVTGAQFGQAWVSDAHVLTC
jgi:hypothetical protein